MIINDMPGISLGKTTANASTIINSYTAYNGNGDLIIGTASAGITPNGAEYQVLANGNFLNGDYGQLQANPNGTHTLLMTPSDQQVGCSAQAARIDDGHVLFGYNVAGLQSKMCVVNVDSGNSPTISNEIVPPHGGVSQLFKIGDNLFLGLFGNYLQLITVNLSTYSIVFGNDVLIASGTLASTVEVATSTGGFVYYYTYYWDSCSGTQITGRYKIPFVISNNTITMGTATSFSANYVNFSKPNPDGTVYFWQYSPSTVYTFDIINKDGSVLSTGTQWTADDIAAKDYVFYDTESELYIIGNGMGYSFDTTTHRYTQVRQVYDFSATSYPTAASSGVQLVADVSRSYPGGTYPSGSVTGIFCSVNPGTNQYWWYGTCYPSLHGYIRDFNLGSYYAYERNPGYAMAVCCICATTSSRGLVAFSSNANGTWAARYLFLRIYGNLELTKPIDRTSGIVKNTVNSGDTATIYLTYGI